MNCYQWGSCVRGPSAFNSPFGHRSRSHNICPLDNHLSGISISLSSLVLSWIYRLPFFKSLVWLGCDSNSQPWRTLYLYTTSRQKIIEPWKTCLFDKPFWKIRVCSNNIIDPPGKFMSVRRTDGSSWKIYVCSRNKWTLLENYKKVGYNRYLWKLSRLGGCFSEYYIP